MAAVVIMACCSFLQWTLNQHKPLKPWWMVLSSKQIWYRTQELGKGWPDLRAGIDDCGGIEMSTCAQLDSAGCEMALGWRHS